MDVHHPGRILREQYLEPLGIAPSRLSESIGIPAGEVAELIAEERSLTPDLAARLGLFFGVPSEWWLVHQARYDAAHLASIEELVDIVKPYEGLADVLVTPNGVKFLSGAEATAGKSSTASYSADFEARLRAQAQWAEETPRTVFETTFEDGTVALIGK